MHTTGIFTSISLIVIIRAVHVMVEDIVVCVVFIIVLRGELKETFIAMTAVVDFMTIV